MNHVKEKILLLLMGGLALACCYSYRKQWEIFKTVSREWGKIKQKELKLGVNSLCRSKFISRTNNDDGSFSFNITEKGKLRALNYKLDNIKNKKGKWDSKWRMVAFDIPERYKNGRDALRHRLREVGFCELQKSVFITPYECKEEISLLVKFFNLNKYVRFAVLEWVDNAEYFKKFFKLV